jgi:hypothetical protein
VLKELRCLVKRMWLASQPAPRKREGHPKQLSRVTSIAQ